MSRHNCASTRFCSSMVTPIAIILSPGVLPARGANRSKPSAKGLDAHHAHGYSQLVLKTGLQQRRSEGITKDSRGSEKTGYAERFVRKWKGCDIGYAPAASSCERAYSVDTCTVAALDAITAFAVPNPGSPSQSQPVFSGLVALQVALPSESLSLLRSGKVHFANPFSRRRGTN